MRLNLDELSLLKLEDFEVYKIVFEIPTFQENPIHSETFQDDPCDVFVEKNGEKNDISSKCESLTMEVKKVCTKPKVVEKEVEKVVIKQELKIKKWESNVNEVYKTPKSENNGEKFGELVSPKVGEKPYMGSFGSLRKEKEWRRTLACKLFEERHNGSNKSMSFNDGSDHDGGRSDEGMDLLWETYEMESTNKGKSKERESKKGRKKDNATRIEELMKMKDDDHHVVDDDYDDDVINNGKFCCLQALKLSAGKMNLSMGMRFSKAFKGFGLLQSHAKKQGRKGSKYK